MRAMLWLGVLLVTLAGIQLYFLPGRTDRLFAWTIDVPLTAAFLGAFYWTSTLLAGLSALQTEWANARVGLVGVQVFVWLTLVATLLHLGKFHFSAGDAVARGAAWLWLTVYAVDPPLLSYAYLRQLRAPGTDPPRRVPPPGWFRATIGLQALLTIGVGVGLFVAPDATDGIWPWSLTPLTARAIASWLLGLGLVLVWGVKENDWLRLRPATASYSVLGILQLLAVWRYSEAFEWAVSGWIYLASVAVVVLLGLYGMVATHRAKVLVTQRPGGLPTN